MASLPTWGPEYNLSFDLYINSLKVDHLQHGHYAEILRFTTSNFDCCEIGDRIPAVFTYWTTYRGHWQYEFYENGISVATQIHNKGNYYSHYEVAEKGWMTIEIRQFPYEDIGRDKS